MPENDDYPLCKDNVPYIEQFREKVVTKKITLNEKEQMDLFCTAWHLTNLIEDCKENKIASFTTPCETCKYQKKCCKNNHFDFYSHAETLTKLTGVKFFAAIGARELSKKGKLKFIDNSI